MGKGDDDMQAETWMTSAPFFSSAWATVVQVLVTADTATDGKIFAHYFPNRPQCFQRYFHPVIKATTKLIITFVNNRGKKLIEQIPMGHVDFDPVCPCGLYAFGSIGKNPYQLMNFCCRQG